MSTDSTTTAILSQTSPTFNSSSKITFNNNQYGANVNRLKSVFFSSSTPSTTSSSSTSSSTSSSMNITTSPCSTSIPTTISPQPIQSNPAQNVRQQPPPLPPKLKSKYLHIVNSQIETSLPQMNVDHNNRSRSLSSSGVGVGGVVVSNSNGTGGKLLENDKNVLSTPLNKAVSATPPSPTKINGIYIDQFLPNTTTSTTPSNTTTNTTTTTTTTTINGKMGNGVIGGYLKGRFLFKYNQALFQL